LSSDEPKAGPSTLGQKDKPKRQKKQKAKSDKKQKPPSTKGSCDSYSDSDNRQLCSWDQEVIPQVLIGARSYHLYQKAIENDPERKTPTTPRQFDIADFAAAAEESLAHERLTIELYSAERLPFIGQPHVNRPRWTTAVYSFRRISPKLSRVFNAVNSLRRDTGDPLDSYLDYYWNLTQRGHELYQREKETQVDIVYVPSTYRQKVLLEDVQSATFRGFLRSR